MSILSDHDMSPGSSLRMTYYHSLPPYLLDLLNGTPTLFQGPHFTRPTNFSRHVPNFFLDNNHILYSHPRAPGPHPSNIIVPGFGPCFVLRPPFVSFLGLRGFLPAIVTFVHSHARPDGTVGGCGWPPWSRRVRGRSHLSHRP